MVAHQQDNFADNSTNPTAIAPRTRRTRHRREGYIFTLAIVSLAVLLILGVLSIRLSLDGLRRATRERDLAQALHAAEAVADMSEKYLRSLPSPPAGTGPYAFPVDNSSITLSTGTAKATIYCGSGNTGSWAKKYIIESVGESGGGTRTVILQLRQQSFALFSYFTDQEVSSVSDNTIWFWSKDRLYGPVHSNDQFHIDWDKTSADPIFYGTVSSAQSSIDWGSAGAPKNTNDWRRVLDAGQAALTLNADRIDLPETSDGQKIAAWGSATGFPTSNGIRMPVLGNQPSAGIYVTGDCSITFSVDNSSGSQIVAIKQGSTTKTITVDLQNNQTRISGDSNIYYGLPNGVIYCTGNITSLKGELANNYVQGSTIVRRNSWTIATDVAAGKDVAITDNLKYKTEPDASQPPTHNKNLNAPVLGVVAEDIKLTNACPNELTIDGVMLAGGENTTNGTFWYEGYASNKRNNLNLLGGLIQKKRGPVGQFDQSKNVQTSGYVKNYRYDPRMADTPPPFFPLTGKFDLVSWQYK